MYTTEQYKQLEAERDALAMQVSKMRESLEVLACLGNGDSYGNSHGNCIAQIALLAIPDLSTEVIRKHDAAIREEMLDMFRLKHRDYANELATEMEQTK